MNIPITQHKLKSPTGASSVNFAAIHLWPQIHWHVRTSCVKKCFFQRHGNDFSDFDFWVNPLPSVLLIFFSFAQVSDGRRMGRSLTLAATQSWRYQSTLAQPLSTHSVTLWTPWGSTKANMSATHPTSWGQLSLTRPYSAPMVRTHWWLIIPNATPDQLLWRSH